MKTTTAIFAVSAALATSAFAQGSLTPPGAPAPTMKTLNQVEPRMPISSAPYTISQSGSYYLTANLSATVTIAANNVTLDLMGFAIIAASGNSISQIGPRANVLVRNGVLSAPAGNGIDFSTSTSGANGVLENLRISGCQNYGIAVGGGYRVRRCDIRGAGLAGLRVSGDSDIQNNRVTGNGIGLLLTGTDAHVADNIVKGNSDNYDLVEGNQLNILLSEVPETIDWASSVKLAGNLTSTSHGVVIAAGGVTLDLMGFTLSGDRGTADYGIYLDGATDSTIRNVVVRNGIVRNFGNGLRAEFTQDSRFEHLITASNSYYGVYLDGSYGQCDGNTLTQCTISGNLSHGIYLKGYFGQCVGNTLADCTISGNRAYGIYLSGSSGQCNGNTITDCTLNGNREFGIFLSGVSGECNGNAITDCTLNGNGSFGIYLYALNGQCAGNTIADCTIRKNGSRGIFMYYVGGNRVEGNHITGQTGTTTDGITCFNTEGNLIFRNTCVGQTYNFRMDTDDTYGPIVTSTGALSGTDPWANFSR